MKFLTHGQWSEYYGSPAYQRGYARIDWQDGKKPTLKDPAQRGLGHLVYRNGQWERVPGQLKSCKK